MAIGSWTAGQRITASRLNLITPQWASWTPTWTTQSGAATPSYGNASVDCMYTQTGDIVFARYAIIFGSTTNFGGGGAGDNWLFSLPVTAAAVENPSGHAELNFSVTQRVYSNVRLFSSTQFFFETSTGRVDGVATTNTGVVDAITPETWASADAIRGTLTYRAA